MAIVTMRGAGHFRQSLVDLINATGPVDTMLEVGSYAGESADTIDIMNALKLKPRIISGHDYASWCPGVIQAVDELLGKPHMNFPDGSWLVRM